MHVWKSIWFLVHLLFCLNSLAPYNAENHILRKINHWKWTFLWRFFFLILIFHMRKIQIAHKNIENLNLWTLTTFLPHGLMISETNTTFFLSERISDSFLYDVWPRKNSYYLIHPVFIPYYFQYELFFPSKTLKRNDLIDKILKLQFSTNEQKRDKIVEKFNWNKSSNK